MDKCLLNSSKIADEFHYILECNVLPIPRKEYLHCMWNLRPNVNKFHEIMLSKNAVYVHFEDEWVCLSALTQWDLHFICIHFFLFTICVLRVFTSDLIHIQMYLYLMYHLLFDGSYILKPGIFKDFFKICLELISVLVLVVNMISTYFMLHFKHWV